MWNKASLNQCFHKQLKTRSAVLLKRQGFRAEINFNIYNYFKLRF